MDSLRINMAGVQRRKRKMVEDEHQFHAKRTADAGIELIMGEGRFVAPKTIEVALNDGDTRRIVSERVFLQQVVGSNPTFGSKKSSKHEALKVHLGCHSVDLSRVMQNCPSLSSFESKEFRNATACKRSDSHTKATFVRAHHQLSLKRLVSR